MKKLTLSAAMAVLSATVWAAYTPPCTITASAETASQWLAIDANSDGEDHYFNFSENDGVPCFKYVQMPQIYGNANDWLFTPAVTVQAGKTYKVTVEVWNKSAYSSDKQEYTVTYGSAQDVAAHSSTIFTETGLKTSSDWAVKSGNFTPSADGDVYLGLHLTSAGWSGDFWVKSFAIEEVVYYPKQVTEMVATPGGDGALSATISWRYPWLNTNNSSLTGTLGARIYRSASAFFTPSEETLVATTEMTESPGSVVTYVDNAVPESGMYYYKIIPYDEKGASTVSASNTAGIWIGPDVKAGSVTNLQATAESAASMQVSLTWDAPTVGGNGGYIDPANLSYRILRSKDGANKVTIEENWQGELPYVDSNLEGLGSYVYSVSTIYNEQSSVLAESAAVVAGGSAEIPYYNDFSTAGSTALFNFFHGGDGTRDWQRGSKNCLTYWGRGEDVNAWALTPIFHFEAGKTYQLEFKTWVSGEKESHWKNLTIALAKGATVDDVETAFFSEIIKCAESNATTRTVTFSVPNDADRYIAFGVVGNVNNVNDIYVDNVSVTLIETVPEAATDLSVIADATGLLSATVSWTNPSTYSNGSPLASISSVTVKRGEEIIATLTDDLTPGAVSSYVDSTIPEAGNYTYSVVVNAGGNDSAPVSADSPWIGLDMPLMPQNVLAEVTAEGVVITFDEVTATVHNGVIAGDGLKYVVKRNDDVIAENLTATTYTDTEDMPLGKYTYTVAAVNGDLQGDFGVSNSVIFGDALELPYSADFSVKETFDVWTLNSGWYYYLSSSKLNVSNTTGWAFTPRISMSQGSVQLSYKAGYASYRDENSVLQISLCRSNDAAEPQMVGTPVEYTIVTSMPETETAVFEVPADGEYYIGMKAITINGYMGVDVSQFDLEQASTTSIRDLTADSSLRYDASTETLLIEGRGRVALYTAAGVCVLDAEVDGELNIGTLESGVYVAIFNGKHLKFVK